VTKWAGLPVEWSETGGGFPNSINAYWQRIRNPPVARLGIYPSKIDADGPHGLSHHNYDNIVKGFADAGAPSNGPSLASAYGYGPQSGMPAGVGDWRYSLAGIDPANPLQPAPPPESGGVAAVTSKTPVRFLTGLYGNKPPPSVFDTGAPPMRFPLEALLSPDRNAALAAWSSFRPRRPVARPPPAPPNFEGSMGDLIMNRIRSLREQAGSNPQASASDTGAPAAPLVPPDNQNFSGGLPGRIAALAGIDPMNPTQFAPPPLDDQLRAFYRDDPAWFLQLRR